METSIRLLNRTERLSVRGQNNACLKLAASVLILWLINTGAAAGEPSGPDTFKLGPGDHILINVFGEEDLSMDVQINNSGTLNYPFLGELTVEGLTVRGLEQMITQGLKGPYLVDPDVTVSIEEYRPFYLYGEVSKPGGIPYQPGLTLQKAIALGGGFTERASTKKITVIRASDTNALAKPIELNDPVHPGDVITVQESFF